LQQTTCNRRHATDDMQLEAYYRQHATYSRLHATDSMQKYNLRQHAVCNAQQTACDLAVGKHATFGAQTCGRRAAAVRRVACALRTSSDASQHTGLALLLAHPSPVARWLVASLHHLLPRGSAGGCCVLYGAPCIPARWPVRGCA
jgi:hypothetical protein